MDKMWNNSEQAYRVKEWSQEETTQLMPTTTGKQLACISKGWRKKARRPMEDSEDEESEGEDEQFVCSMTGRQWESLPFPTIVDSGACVSAMPSGWCEHVPVRETQQSRAGEYFRAANGQ